MYSYMELRVYIIYQFILGPKVNWPGEVNASKSIVFREGGAIACLLAYSAGYDPYPL